MHLQNKPCTKPPYKDGEYQRAYPEIHAVLPNGRHANIAR